MPTRMLFISENCTPLVIFSVLLFIFHSTDSYFHQPPVLLHFSYSVVVIPTQINLQLALLWPNVDLSIIFTYCFLPFMLFLLFDPYSLTLFILFTTILTQRIMNLLRHFPPLLKRGKMTGFLSLSALLTVSMPLCTLTAAERAPLPRVHGINPPCGPKIGGTAVFIHGENFVRTKTFCRFGEVSHLISPTLVTSSLVLCKSPPTSHLNPSRVRLQVTNDGGYTYSTDRISFFYSGGRVSAF